MIGSPRPRGNIWEPLRSPRFPISNFQIGNLSTMESMQGQDIALLLKLAIQDQPQMLSKDLAEDLFLSPSEVSKSMKRNVDAGLLSISSGERRVNRTALIGFLTHGLRHTFPPKRGSMARGVPTGAAAEPLKSHFLEDGDPPMVWPYAEGKVRGIALSPLYKGAPRAALRDARFYATLALCDAIRSGRTRERNLAIELLGKALNV